MKKSRKRKAAAVQPKGRGRLFIVTALALTLIATSVILSQRTQRRKPTPGDDFAPASLVSSKPSKEYIYGGGKLVATEEPTAVESGGNTYDAKFVSLVFSPSNAENFGCYGIECSVTIEMQNTGSLPWQAGTTYKLGSLYPDQWEKVISPSNRVPLTSVALNSTVPVGGNTTFTFNVARSSTHPQKLNTSYYFTFQWQMMQEGGVGFFGEKTPIKTYKGGCALPSVVGNFANFVSQSVPSSMYTGQTYSVSVTMNNGGSTTWTSANNYKLGSQNPANNTTWGPSRVALPSSVSPGGNVTFTFNVTAPSTAGTYNFQWMMIQEGVEWFGLLTPGVSVAVTVLPPPAAPSNLFAFAPSGTQVNLSWTDNSSNESGFKIELLDGNNGWVQIATVGANVTTYQHSGLTAETQYCYRVRAYNAGGNSNYSNQSCAWTQGSGY